MMTDHPFINPFKRCVIYIRTSTQEQNPQNQLSDCESIRPMKYDTFVDYYLLEEKQSAWKDVERPIFNQLKKAIKKRKVKNLIVWDLDRLFRNREKLITFFKYCKVYGCTIHSFRQKWLEDINKIPEPWGEMVHDMMLQIMGWIAQEESDHRSKKVKASIRVKDGKKYSYKGNVWGRKPISTYKRNNIIKLYELGESMRKISKEVNISLGAVHKTILAYNTQKVQNKNRGSQLVN